MKMAKKVLSVVLAIAMALSCFAVAASAYGPEDADYQAKIWLTASTGTTKDKYWTSNTKFVTDDNEECEMGTIEAEPGQLVWIRVYQSANYYPLTWQTELFYSANLLDAADRYKVDRGANMSFSKTNLAKLRVFNDEGNDWLANFEGSNYSTTFYTPWGNLSPENKVATKFWPTADGSDELLLSQDDYKLSFFGYGVSTEMDGMEDTILDDIDPENAWILKIPFFVPTEAKAGDTFTVTIPEGTFRRAGKPFGQTFLTQLGLTKDGEISPLITVEDPDMTEKPIDMSGNINFDFSDATIVIKVPGGEEPTLDYSALEAAITAKKALSTDGKTAASIATVDAAIKAAEKFVTDAAATSQDEIDAQVSALAAVNYKDLADYTALNTALLLTPAKDQSAYTADSWSAYASALAAAQAVNKDLEATTANQKTINDAAAALTAAFNALAEPAGPADKTALAAAIAQAEALVADNYVDFSGVAAALAAAKSVNDNAALTADDQATIDNATNALTSAMGALVEADADYTALDAAIAAGNAVDLTKVKTGKDAFVQALDAAKAVAKDLKKKDQATVDTAANNLTAAMGALTYFGGADYTTLDAAIADTPAYPANYYVDAAYAAYTTALAAANAVARDLDESAQLTIDAAAQTLANANAALKLDANIKDADYSAYDAAASRLVATDVDKYTAESVQAFQDACNAVPQGKKIYDQAVVDAAIAAINDVVLVYKSANTAALEAAIAKAEGVDSSLVESTAALDSAVAAGQALLNKDGLNVTDQAEVDAAAKAINDAYDALVWLGANYKDIDDAIAAFEALDNTLYTADSYAAAQTAYTAAKAVARDLGKADQAVIDAAAAALTSAIEALVYADADYTALNAAKSAAALKKEVPTGSTMKNYTEETWTAFAAAKAAADAVPAGLKKDSQATIDAAAKDLADATAALEYADFDYTATNAIVDKFNALNKDLYTADSVKAVQDLVDALVMTYKMNDYAKGMGQYSKLNTAYNKLALANADYTALDAAIAAAEALNAADWTADSFAGIAAPLAAAKAVARDLKKDSQATIDDATAALNAAIDALVAFVPEAKDADYTALDAAIAAAEALDAAAWTADSFAGIAAPLAAAKAVARDLKEDDQKVIDDAAAALNAAIDALVPYVAPKAADYTALNAAKNAAAQVNEAAYTEDSYAALAAAVAAAAQVPADLTEEDQKVIDDAAAAINAAIAALVEKPAVIGGAVTNVEYTPSKDTHNTFTITVTGRPAFVQFVEFDHGNGTRSYDRYNSNVSIVSYDKDGNVVDSRSKDLAYEVWTVNTNLSVGETGVRVRNAAGWESVDDAYKFVYQTAPTDSAVLSAELAATSGKQGPVAATIVTGPDVEYVQLKMDDGSTCTYAASKATVNGDGNLVFTGKAWANHSGENVITVRVLAANKWTDAATLTYTAE